VNDIVYRMRKCRPDIRTQYLPQWMRKCQANIRTQHLHMQNSGHGLAKKFGMLIIMRLPVPPTSDHLPAPMQWWRNHAHKLLSRSYLLNCGELWLSSGQLVLMSLGVAASQCSADMRLCSTLGGQDPFLTFMNCLQLIDYKFNLILLNHIQFGTSVICSKIFKI
jgi:hypothetical protein